MKNSLYIITGSSKGLGKGLVHSLLKNDQNRIMGISRSGLGLMLDNYIDLLIDLSDTDALVDQLENIFPYEDYERIVLINNAGWIGEIGPLGRLDPKGIADLHAINVVAPAVLMNAYIQRYQKHPAEKLIINISSGAAVKNIDGWSGYSSSKAALNRMTEIAQEESNLNKYDIKYFALSPGIIDSPMQEAIRSASHDDFSNVETFRNYKNTQQLSSPEEVSEKIIYLINNAKSFEEVLQDVRKF
ncbi:MAG TPA: SDR family NAD(P)-dependent oxidoreductase [Anditalea sp.]|nr:SDR family NAD(P)-dependent oxidoreductase [Anditalea sp.]